MKLRHLFFLICIWIGCQKPENPLLNDCRDADYTFPEFESSQTNFNDCDLLNATYTNYFVPIAFYSEDVDGSIYYENTVSIGVYGQENPEWIELCTDSLELASAWSETSAVRSSYYRIKTSERETVKFFEFRRVWEEYPSDIILSRVHKCSYLDRTMFDYFDPDSLIGMFNIRPINTQNSKELSEYLWLNDKTGSSKVLSSFIIDSSDFVEHTFYEIFISYGDWGMCDLITLKRRLFRIDKDTGYIIQLIESIKSIEGECR